MKGREVKWAVSLTTSLSSVFSSLTGIFLVAKRCFLMFFLSSLIQSAAIHREVFCTPPFTFEYGADVFPDGDAAAVMELTESQLHVEERHTSEHCHQQVRQQKGT